MKKINPDVRKAVLDFVDQGQSFNSLDIYCVLGVRIDDDEYPIYDQVWDMFKNREMPSYLSQFVTIKLECGGYANVWRYYRPTSECKRFPGNITGDGRLEVSREALGHFPLLDIELACSIEDGKIVLRPATESSQLVYDPKKRVKFSSSFIKAAGLADYNSVEIRAYLNHIEVVGID